MEGEKRRMGICALPSLLGQHAGAGTTPPPVLGTMYPTPAPWHSRQKDSPSPYQHFYPAHISLLILSSNSLPFSPSE